MNNQQQQDAIERMIAHMRHENDEKVEEIRTKAEDVAEIEKNKLVEKGKVALEGKYQKSKEVLAQGYGCDESKRRRETNWTLQAHRNAMLEKFVEELRHAIIADLGEGEMIDERLLENLLHSEEPYLRETMFGSNPNREHFN